LRLRHAKSAVESLAASGSSRKLCAKSRAFIFGVVCVLAGWLTHLLGLCSCVRPSIAKDATNAVAAHAASSRQQPFRAGAVHPNVHPNGAATCRLSGCKWSGGTSCPISCRLVSPHLIVSFFFLFQMLN